MNSVWQCVLIGKSEHALYFCLALGAVVRLVAPLLQHKHKDPGIVAIDDAGQFVKGK